MSKHIAKETELNRYSPVNNLDKETLWFKFGQLSKEQEQIRLSVREFIKECANEIRTETDSRNAKLVEKILDKHNRLVEILFKKSSFLKTVIDELGVTLSSNTRLSKEQITKILSGLIKTINGLMQNKTSDGKTTTQDETTPFALLTNKTLVEQLAKNFRTRINLDYRKALSDDRKIANGFRLPRNLSNLGKITKSCFEPVDKFKRQLGALKITSNQISAISTLGSSRRNGGTTKSAQVEKLKLYNEYVINRTENVIERVEKSLRGMMWFKIKDSLTDHIRKFKTNLMNGLKSVFSAKSLKAGVGFIGKTLTTVLLKPIGAVGKLLCSSLKGIYDFGIGLAKGAFKTTGKILKFLNDNLLKKIFKFVFSPSGMFVLGYLVAFFRVRIGPLFTKLQDIAGKWIHKISSIVGKIKTGVAKGLVKIIDGISTNKVLVAFLTKDAATIAQFVDTIKMKFRQKFDAIRDFFKDMTSNMAANVFAGGLSWIGAAIGTCLGGPLGSIIGSLAGAGLAMLLGKLFANTIYSLPDHDADAADALIPVYKKFGTFRKGDVYKESGLAEKIKQSINKLQAEADERVRKYKDGETTGYDLSDIHDKIDKLKKLQSSVDNVSQENDYGEFYSNVRDIIDATSKVDPDKSWINKLPNTGDELMELVNSKNPTENIGKFGHHVDVDGIQVMVAGHSSSLVYKQTKMQVLNKLYRMARKVNMDPETFCRTYGSWLENALDVDYSQQLMQARDKTGMTDFNSDNFELTRHTKLRDYLTRPLIDKNGEGIFQPSDKVDKDDIKSFTKSVQPKIRFNISDMSQDNADTTYKTIVSFVNSCVAGDGPNTLNSIISQICNGDGGQIKFLKESFPVESWFRTYINRNIFDYYYINDAGAIAPIENGGRGLFDGFRDFMAQLIGMPEISDVVSQEVKKKEGFFDNLNKLRKRLVGVIDEQDTEVQEGLKKLEDNENEMKADTENDPEYKELMKELEQKKSQYNELLQSESESQAELVEKAKSIKPVVAVQNKKTPPKTAISEEEREIYWG